MEEEKEQKAVDVHIKDGDQALEEFGEVVVYTEPLSPEEDRRILRRIDTFLLPALAISYLFQFLDKQAMSYTSILGLRTDLHLVGQEYSWAGSIFYFGYLAASYPASLLLVRLPVGKFLALSVCVWSVVLMCMAANRNASGLLATRFFLGFAEAAVAPGFSVVTSMWYKRSEQPLRHGAWFMGNVISGLFGSIVAYAMGHITSIAPWKAVFLVFGAATMLWSFTLFVLLPDTPANAWFLKKDDRAKAVKRVEENMTGIKNRHWKKYQLVDALLDPQAWILVLIQLCCNIPNGGITNFGSIVIEGLGFSTFNTLLVQMISVGFQAVWVLMATCGSTLFKNTRTYWMAFMLLVALAGTVMIREIEETHKWSRFMGYCILIAFSANFPMVLTMTAANIGGFTKKTTVNAMIFLAYCTGNIIGPQLFFDSEAPDYDSGFLSMIICFCVGVILCMVLRFYYIWENKRRERSGENVAIHSEDLPDVSLNLADKTDRELRQFRYVY